MLRKQRLESLPGRNPGSVPYQQTCSTLQGHLSGPCPEEGHKTKVCRQITRGTLGQGPTSGRSAWGSSKSALPGVQSLPQSAQSHPKAKAGLD